MIHQGPTTIVDGELTAREVTPADMQVLYDLRMDEATRHMFRNPDIVSYEQHQQFVNRYFTEENSDCWFVIEVDGRVVGSMALCGLDREHSVCESGRLIIDPRYRGCGYAKRAMKLLIRFATELGFDRIRGEVLEANTVQRRNVASLGYQEVATFTSGGRRFVEVHLQLPARP
jgi:RimJ/RimL family protein N-acetyltransferase